MLKTPSLIPTSLASGARSAARFSDALFGVGGERPDLWMLEGGEFTRRTWEERQRDAARVAGSLRTLGVEPGGRICCVLANSHAACETLLGAWLAGAVVLSLPPLSRGMDSGEYVVQLAGLCERSESDLLLLEQRFVAALGDGALPGLRVVAFESLVAAGACGDAAPPADGDVVFVQFSSGSTRDPAGCMLTAAAIADQIERLGDAVGIGPGDVGVGWIPLSHDMSLFGMLLMSWFRGTPLALGTPERFLRSPRSWLRDCSDFRATLTASPSFALDMLLKHGVDGSIEPFPLRACILGSDRIEWRTLQRTAALCGPAGFSLRTLTPAYGLAEATLAVTSTAPSELPRRVRCAPDALAAGEVVRTADEEPAVDVVCCGRPLPGVETTVAGNAAVGELHVRSPSLASGYLGDRQATRRRFRPGALATGDLGFLLDGELYVTGRLDDLIVVRGRNVYARDLELALSAHPAVRSGSATVVDVHGSGGQRLVLIAEAQDGSVDFGGAALELQRLVTATAGVTLDEFVFLCKGALPKTPSGKIQRHRCRALVASPPSDVVAVVS